MDFGIPSIVGGLVVIGVVLTVMAIVLLVFRSWVKVARADEALVISGAKKKSVEGDDEVRVVIKGRAIVNPLIYRLETISLRSRQVSMAVQAQSKDNVTVNVNAVAIVKIGSTTDLVIRASERFASQDEAIEIFTTEQLEGALRGVVARLDVVELLRDRKKFGDEIAETVSGELGEQGLLLDSFQIKDITDPNGYINSLGIPEIQAKHREAEIAKTNAERATRKQVLINEETNLVEQTAYEKNKADSNAEVGKANAVAEQAAELARTTAYQAVLEQKANNKQAELDSEVRKVADAELYAAQKEVDKEAYARLKDAEIRAEVAEREALAIRTEAEAQSDAIRLKGVANADSIRAEADALRENQQAVLAQRLVEILPSLMTEFARGYENIGNLSIVGGSGTSAGDLMSGENAVAMQAIFETVKNATGVDLPSIIQGRVAGEAAGSGFREGAGDRSSLQGTTE